jgi:hypothetical protein
MRHGDELWLLRAGITLPAKSVEALGIRHGSRCWGVFTRPQTEVHDKRAGPERSIRRDYRHLVVSPIHPDDWDSAFHLDIKLANFVGSIAAATAKLRSLGINILMSECVPTGYTHGSLSLICSIGDDLRHVLKRRLDGCKFSPSAEHDSLTEPREGEESKAAKARRRRSEERLREAGARMILVAAFVRTALRMADMRANDEGDHKRSFLSGRLVEDGGNPWFLRPRDIKLLSRALAGVADPSPGDDQTATDRTLDHDVALILSDYWDRILSRRRGKGGKGQTGESKWYARLALLLAKAESIPSKSIEQSAGAIPKRLTRPKDLRSEQIAALVVGETWRDQWSRAVAVRVLTRLAYIKAWADDTLQPIGFRYDGDRGLLVPEGSEARELLRRGLAESELSPIVSPAFAVASIHSIDRFLRMSFSPRVLLEDRMFRLSVKYTARATTQRRGPLANGLIAAIAKELSRQGVDVLRMSDSILEYAPTVERVELLFLCVLPAVKEHESARDVRFARLAAVKAGVESTLAQFEKELRDVAGHHVVSVTTPLFRSVFLSMPRSAVRGAEIADVVQRVGESIGFDTVSVLREGMFSVSEKVGAEIRNAHAVLQVIVLREEDAEALRENPNHSPDFAWLHHEYGAATALGRPCVRIVDRTIPRALRERLFPVDRERPVIEFSTQAGIADFERAAERALGLLSGHAASTGARGADAAGAESRPRID